MQSPKHIIAFFLTMALGVLGALYYPHYLAEQGMTARLTTLLTTDPPVSTLPVLQKTTRCVIKEGLPDSECTPGSVFPNVTLDTICVKGYTKTVRNVPVKLKKAVYASYDVSFPQPRGSYELDHVIPLALGGNNESANLFPQPAEPSPGFREKDVVEIWLYKEACAGRINLDTAQYEIARNWLSIYDGIPKEERERIRSEFKNWSN